MINKISDDHITYLINWQTIANITSQEQ